MCGHAASGQPAPNAKFKSRFTSAQAIRSRRVLVQRFRPEGFGQELVERELPDATGVIGQ